MKHLITYITLLFCVFSYSQIASVKTIKHFANNERDASIRFFLDDFPSSSLTVTYVVTGATSKVDISSGNIIFSTSELSKDVTISKTGLATGVEDVTITISTSANYTVDGFNDSATIQIREDAPVLAFPTAMGAGAFTSGGRGGTVIHVTNLNDSGAGSFREAITTTGTRTIVFDVSGTIPINSPIYLDASHSNVTVAGQTAPNGGITLEGQAIGFFKTENVIFRYVRIVSKHWLQTSTNAAAITFSGGNDVIVDHISARYVVGTSCISAQEDNDTNNGQGNITIQKSIFGDSTTGMLLGAIVQDPRSTYGGTNSCLNNFFINISHRFPNVSGNTDAETINNVVYNYFNRLSSLFNNSRTNIIGNYYKGGTHSYAAYGDGNQLGVYLDSGTTAFNNPQAFYSENRIESANSSLVSGQDNWVYMKEWYTPTDRNDTFDQTPYKINSQLTLLGEPITVQSANNAFTYVLNDVGANAGLDENGTKTTYLDAVDTAYIADAQNGTNNTANGTDYIDTTNESALTYPTLPTNTRGANYDTDNDGMPDTWETATFGDLTRDGTGDLDADGYTDLEEFLNLVDDVPLVENVQSSGVTQTTLTISWDAVTGATSYDVYRDSNLQSNVTGGTTYNDSGLTAGTTYSYRIDAKDSGGSVLGSSQSLSVQTQAAVTVGNGISKERLLILMN